MKEELAQLLRCPPRLFGRIAAEFLALRFTSYRMLTMLQRGTVPGPEGALAKVTTVRAAR